MRHSHRAQLNGVVSAQSVPSARSRGGDAPDPADKKRGGRGEHGARGQRRSRPFGNGDLKLILLAAIGEAPSHGYELIRSIEERVGGAYSPSPGIVYPTLTLMEETGLLSGEADGAKKLYSITQFGRAQLAEQQAQLGRIDARMHEFGLSSGHGRDGLVTRAMENLKLAVRLRLAASALNEAQLNELRRILDESATAIERL